MIRQLTGEDMIVQPQFYNRSFELHILVFATSKLFLLKLGYGYISHEISFDYPTKEF